MVHGAVRKLFQLLGALVAGLLIALPLFAWRLASGPIALDFLTPYIEEALSSKESGLAVDLDTTVLALAEGERLVEIRVLGVVVRMGEGATPVATVPEAALTLNGHALLGGVIAPKAVRLYNPRLRLVRDEAGRLSVDIGDQASGGGNDVVRGIVDALVGVPDPARPGRHLQRFSVIDADLEVEDRALALTWHAPDADIHLTRTAAGIAASASLVLDLGGEAGSIGAEVSYNRADDSLAGEISLAGIRPALLARLGGPLAPLAAVDMPLAGTVTARGSADGRIDEVTVDLAGGEGRVTVAAPVAFDHSVAAIHLRAAARDGFTRVRVDELHIDLGGPTVTLAAVADGLGGETVVKADAVLREVPFDSLHRLWPEAVAPNPRDWVLANLSQGIVHEARATLSLRSPSGNFDDLVVEHVDGNLEGDGVTVDYLRPMPAVRNAAASASFDASDFRIAVKGGQVYGLKLVDGQIVLSGLDQGDQFADIDITVEGPAPDALRLIDNQPLRYARALGIDPGSVGGQASTRLRLKFPLLKDLRLDDLEIKADASLKKVSVPKVLMGLDLSNGDLEMKIDAKGLDAKGPVVLGTIPAELAWRENFSSKGVAFRSRYRVTAPSVDEAQRRALGLDGPPFVAPYVEGPVAAEVTATLFGGGKGEVDAKVDLSPARMRLPGLGWRKEERTTGGAEVTVRLEKMKIAAVPRFAVQAGNLQTRGAVSFRPDGSVRKVEFERLAYGRTDVSGSLAFRPGGGLDVVARGPSFDAEPVIGDDDQAPDAPPPERGPRRKSDLPPMTVSGGVGTMWLSRKGGLRNASISMSRDADDWRSISLKGTVGEGKWLTADLRQAGPNRRDVKVMSDDAGSVARAFDVYDDLIGGRLEISGYYDDTKDDQPVVGTISVADYNIVNAPALAKLLNVAALTGVLDLLNNQGISFTTLEAPFVFGDGLLKVTDARAYGPAIGITAKGEIDLDASRLALEGTVVPAYALNSVLGNIPVLGWLITGGEKGGGLLAFNYTMKGPTQEPDVVVNPLSALTPGFLRNLFNIFDDGSETEARKKAPAK